MHYSVLDELMASPTQALPAASRQHLVGVMLQALAAIKADPAPSTDHWKALSDMVNMMETLVQAGELEDTNRLIDDAVGAMVRAANRFKAGQALRFDGEGVQTMAALAEDFAAAVEALPARVMVRCHRATEKRIGAIRAGRHQPGDVLVEL